MAYSKQWKATQDYAVGFRDINRIADSIEQIRADFGVKHTGPTSGEGLGRRALTPRGPGQPSPPPWTQFGAHNDTFNPRGIIVVDGTTYTYANGSSGWQWSIDLATPGILAGATRLAAGHYLFSFVGLANKLHAVAQPYIGDVAGTRFATARMDSTTDAVRLCQVTLIRQSTANGTFALSDFPFSVSVYQEL